MSGSINIYPFQDTETTIRFGFQVALFLIGLAITNKLIIQPALKLQFERKKRTTGNQSLAQKRLEIAENLERSYTQELKKAIEEACGLRDSQIKQAKETANVIIASAQAKSANYVEEIKSHLRDEKQKASSEIHLHVHGIVKDIYSKFGIIA